MRWIIFKYCVTSFIVVVTSEVAKVNDRIGGLLAALPLVTVLTLIWLRLEKESSSKIRDHAWYTLWYVIPTLPMFVLFPIAYGPFNFWWSLLLSCLMTAFLFASFALFMERFNVRLMETELEL